MSRRGYNLGPAILALIVGYLVVACTAIYISGGINEIDINKDYSQQNDKDKTRTEQ